MSGLYAILHSMGVCVVFNPLKRFLEYIYFFLCLRALLLSITSSDGDISVRIFSLEHSNRLFVTSQLEGLSPAPPALLGS